MGRKTWRMIRSTLPFYKGLFFSSLFCLALPNVPGHPVNDLGNGDKIVGGEDARRGEFPWQVMLTWGLGGSLMCGGSLLSDRMVVTAAHCCDQMTPSDFGVVVGAFMLYETDPDEASFNVKNVIMHEEYNGQTKENDICLLELDGAADLSSPNIGTIQLPLEGEEYEPGTMCTVTGWGATSEGGSLGRILQKVDIPLVSDNDCQFAYIFNEITDSMMCAGFDEGGKDSCQGDSGDLSCVEINCLGLCPGELDAHSEDIQEFIHKSPTSYPGSTDTWLKLIHKY